MRSLPAIAIVALAACEAEPDADDVVGPAPDDVGAPLDGADVLTTARTLRYGGCGDTTIYVADALDHHAIFVSASGLVEDAQQAGAPVTVSVALPSPDVWLAYMAGARLTVATCVGAYPPRGPRVLDARDAISGRVDLVATPDASGGADVSVHLRNVTFVGVSGAPFVVPSLRIPAQSVGFYPP